MPCVSSGSTTGITAGITGRRICDDNISSSSSLKSTSYNTRRSRGNSWKVSGGDYYTPSSGGNSPPSQSPQSGPSGPVTNICGRTQKVQDALLQATRETNCQQVPTAKLNNLQSLDLSGSYPAGALNQCDSHKLHLSTGDFDDLTSLRELDLSENCLAQQNPSWKGLPSGVFNPLESIETIDLLDTDIGSLCNIPSDLFTNILSTLNRIKVTGFCYDDGSADYYSKLWPRGDNIFSGCGPSYCR